MSEADDVIRTCLPRNGSRPVRRAVIDDQDLDCGETVKMTWECRQDLIDPRSLIETWHLDDQFHRTPNDDWFSRISRRRNLPPEATELRAVGRLTPSQSLYTREATCAELSHDAEQTRLGHIKRMSALRRPFRQATASKFQLNHQHQRRRLLTTMDTLTN